MEPSGRSQAGYYNVSLAGSGHVAKEMVHCSDWTVNLLNTNLTGDKENHIAVLDFIYTFPLLSSLWFVHQGPHVVERAMVAPRVFSFTAACCKIAWLTFLPYRTDREKLLWCCCSKSQCCGSKFDLRRCWLLRNEVIILILLGSNITLWYVHTFIYTFWTPESCRQT